MLCVRRPLSRMVLPRLCDGSGGGTAKCKNHESLKKVQTCLAIPCLAQLLPERRTHARRPSPSKTFGVTMTRSVTPTCEDGLQKLGSGFAKVLRGLSERGVRQRAKGAWDKISDLQDRKHPLCCLERVSCQFRMYFIMEAWPGVFYCTILLHFTRGYWFECFPDRVLHGILELGLLGC